LVFLSAKNRPSLYLKPAKAFPFAAPPSSLISLPTDPPFSPQPRLADPLTLGRQPPALLLAASTWNRGEEDEQKQPICNEADPKEAEADLKKGESETV
jgi:hypothetical protein